MNFVLTRPQVDDNNSMDHEMVGLNQRTPSGSGSTSSSSSANQYHYSQQQQQQEQQQQQQQYSSPTLVWHGSNIIIHGNTSGRRNKPGGMCGSGSCFRPCGGPWCATILVVVTTAILVVTMPTLFSVLEASAASGRSGASASDAIDGIGTGNSNNNGIPLFRPKKVHHETHGHDDGPRGRDPVTIVGGAIEGSNYPYPVAYLHRAAGTTATTATTTAATTTNDHANAHVVLLHGAAFTKDTWKTSGILDEFAARTPWLSVTALDLPVSADYRTLARILTDLVGEEGIAVELPLSALVTPSASGRAVTTWIRGETNTNNNNNNADETATALHLSEITDFFRLWIPVASYSVGKCTADELHGLRDTTTLGVAAVHGTKDGKGKKMSEMLEEHANARVYELEGKHPVYLDQPAAFVKLVGEEVANLQQQ